MMVQKTKANNYLTNKLKFKIMENTVKNSLHCKELNYNEMLNVSGGSVASCVWATVTQHYIKTILFGAIYVIGVAVGCDS